MSNKVTRPAGLLIRRYLVRVTGYGEGPYVARSPGKALADAWNCDAFYDLSFRDFLKIAKARLDPCQPDFEPITVNGRAAFKVTHNNAYVEFVEVGQSTIHHAHPYEVLPVSARPLSYQDRIDV